MKVYGTLLAMSRPELKSILPSKRTLNRLLFDFDSRLSYRKAIPVLSTVYSNLDRPEEIRLPKSITGLDLMVQKNILATVRNKTNVINKNLVDLENELVEQAAELGDNDAITMLAFETLNSKSTSSAEDFAYAQELVRSLVDKKHPLVFKMLGDLAFFQKKQHASGVEYWKQFLELENDTVMASQVYSNLGVYYFSYKTPKPDLKLAKQNFEKLINVGELDKYTVVAHYYLGQLYAVVDPELGKYHLEVAASQGLKESFATLGFLEMNTFKEYVKAIEWFNLGNEVSNDLTCMVGKFDCYVNLKEYEKAGEVLSKLEGIQQQIKNVRVKKLVPKTEELEQSLNANESTLRLFFETRKDSVETVRMNI